MRLSAKCGRLKTDRWSLSISIQGIRSGYDKGYRLLDCELIWFWFSIYWM